MQSSLHQSSSASEMWSTFHAILPQDRTVMGHMRPMIEPMKGRLRGAAARPIFDSMMGEVVGIPIGDSADGNLALLLHTKLVEQSATEAVAAVALSPVTDLAMTGESGESRAAADPYFVRAQVEELISAYLAGHNPNDPTASPLYGNLASLPPIRVYVGDAEVLLDDAKRYVASAVAAGVDARIDVWEGMPHGFIGGVGKLDAANQALTAIGAFLSQQFENTLKA